MTKVKSGINLTVIQVVALNNELKSLGKELGISFLTKYELSKLAEKTAKIVENYQKQNFDLYKTYGEEDKDKKGTYSLVESSKDYDKATAELKNLIEKEEAFTEKFKLDDFKDLKSENSYIQIMKFLESK